MFRRQIHVAPGCTAPVPQLGEARPDRGHHHRRVPGKPLPGASAARWSRHTHSDRYRCIRALRAHRQDPGAHSRGLRTT